ncbi:TVP38/TMEM64 family protein [Novosphingobium sp. MW5]|nr:TVP38/TMEM64 family protein [Novosphingobium sp. MW5]
MKPQARAATAGRRPRKRTVLGGVLLAMALVGASVVSYVPRMRADALRLLTEISAYPTQHWFAFALGQVLIAACGVLPASVMAVMAGAAYGMVKGLAISVVCTLLGGWIAFLLSRSILRPWIEKLLERSRFAEKLDEALEGEGWHFVFLLRISPVMPFALTSYGFGLTRIRQRDYLIGTLASLPALASYVGLGAAGRQGMEMSMSTATPMQWFLLVVGILALLLAAWRTGAVVKKAMGK